MNHHFSIYDLIPGYHALNEWLAHAGVIGEGQSAQHMVSATLVLVLLMLIGLRIRSRYANPSAAVVPPSGFGLCAILDIGVEKLHGMIHDVVGHGYEKHFSLLASIFIYLLLCNLVGSIPGFPPPTSTIANNVAIALTVFIYYNYAGLRANGVAYLKHFAGPVVWLAWLMIPIELVGHCVRPVSLSLRLAGNITGDHMVLGIFTSMTYVLVPVAFVGLGFFVAFLQAFVFTLLSSIYVGLATAHEH